MEQFTGADDDIASPTEKKNRAQKRHKKTIYQNDKKKLRLDESLRDNTQTLQQVTRASVGSSPMMSNTDARAESDLDELPAATIPENVIIKKTS